jgi:hypothetical protein
MPGIWQPVTGIRSGQQPSQSHAQPHRQALVDLAEHGHVARYVGRQRGAEWSDDGATAARAGTSDAASLDKRRADDVADLCQTIRAPTPAAKRTWHTRKRPPFGPTVRPAPADERQRSIMRH